MTILLNVEHIEVAYDQVILAVRDVSLVVPQGAIVALLGANGAGKSTVLKAVSNLVRAGHGEVVKGRIAYAGADVTHAGPARLVRDGLVQVLEGRKCFPQLSVHDNLLAGGYARGRSRAEIGAALDKIYGYFPRLKERRAIAAGYLSGGEQQMLAIGRALMTAPRLVLLDEPSMGLAPQIVEEIFEIVHRLNQLEGMSFLVAEQNTVAALRYASHVYVLENGRVAAHGPASEFAERGDVGAFYLGGAAAA
ncbi:MAG: ABC transporter ATP-binding protein [Gammaproteobacteria bacterium]